MIRLIASSVISKEGIWDAITEAFSAGYKRIIIEKLEHEPANPTYDIYAESRKE